MFDPVVTSALIKTGGSLIGSFFGGDDGPGFQTQLNDSLQSARKHRNRYYGDIMYNAKKYKIHPLAMLGTNPPAASGPVYSGGGSNSNMGQNITQALAKGASEVITGKANKEMNDLVLERAELENELLRSQITSINNPAKAGSAYSNDLRVVGELEDKVLPGTRAERDASIPSKQPGVSDGIAQMFKRVRDNQGGIVYSLDQDVIEGEVAEAINAVVLVFPQLAMANVGAAFNKLYGIKLERDTERRIQRAVRKINKSRRPKYKYNFNNRPDWMKGK